MPVADLAQPFQVALGRQIPAGAASHRLDNDGRHIARVVQRQDAVFQLQQQVFPPLGLDPVDIGVTGMFGMQRIVNKAQVVHARQQCRAESLAVGRNAAHAHAAEAHAVVAALAAYEDIAVAFAARAVPGQRQLQRRIRRLRARIAKQHPVQVAGGHGSDHVSGLEGLVVAGLKGGGVIQCVELLFDRLLDRLAVVPRRHAPQAGDAVEHLPAVVGCKVHAVGSDKNTRVVLEAAVRREGEPLVLHVETWMLHACLLLLKDILAAL